MEGNREIIEGLFAEILERNDNNYLRTIREFVDLLNEVIIYRKYIQSQTNSQEKPFPILGLIFVPNPPAL